MKRLSPVWGKYLVIGCFAVLVLATSYAQTQTPTTPKASPNLSALRESLQKLQQGKGGYGSDMESESTSLKDKRSKKKEGTEGEEKKTEGDQKKAEESPPAAGGPQPPAARGEKKGLAGTRILLPKSALGGQAPAGAATGAGGAVKGGTAGGGAGAPAVRTIGEGQYEPVKTREIEYGEVPDEGDPLTLNGPLPVGEFLDTLALATNWNVLVTEAAKSVQLEFWITETKPIEALEILKFHDIYYEYKKDTKYLYVMTKDEFLEKQFGKLQEKEFVVENADVDYIESILTALLSPQGRAITDPRTRHLFVWDTKDNLAKMDETIKLLDVPLSEKDFGIQHADLPDAEAMLTAMLSPAGTMVSDPRTGHILVKDLPDKLKEMTDVLAKFDVPLEQRVFEAKYVNAETLLEGVEALITERGMAQLDPRTNTVIVTDIPSRQDQIAEMVATLDKKLETRTWVTNYVEPDDVAERIETLVPEEMGDIIVDEDVHQITVTATPERLTEIEDLMKTWDVRRKQVLIQAYLVAVSDNAERELEIKWSYFDSTGNAPQAYRVNGGAAPDYTKLTADFTIGQLPWAEPLRNWVTGDVIKDINGNTIIKEFHGNRVAAMINYLDSKGEATILSSPRVTVQDGEEALFQSGRQVPYVTSSTYGMGSSYNRYNQNNPNDPNNPNNNNQNYYYGYGYQPYNRIDFIEVGTILRVLPRITESDTILLDIITEDSDAEMKIVVANGESNTVPEKKENKAETQVRVQDGQTIVIGGLRKSNATDTTVKSVPVLSDIPVLGRLFKTPNHKVDNAALMAFITTTIVDETTKPEAEQLASVDQDFARKLRSAKKDSFGRLEEWAMQGKNEIMVSVGESGDLYCKGTLVTLEDIRARAASITDKKQRQMLRAVILRHPNAPAKVVTDLTEMLMELDINVIFDEDVSPFVPSYAEPLPYKNEDKQPQASAPAAEAAPEPETAAAVPSAKEEPKS